jgi:hypothetical protein
MKSPFPGMDPYLERYWGDVHASLMVYLRDQINERLPADLQARVEETVSVDVIDGDSRWLYPDVLVVEEPAALEYAPPATVVGAAEPRLITIPAESRTQRHLEIIDSNSGNRVVTAIEVLSPGNKTSESGRRLYRNKQRDYIQGRVNLVEIDLIRAGQFILAVPESAVPDSCRATYMICVRRVIQPHRAELYPIPLRDPLPAIRIPLRPNDTDLRAPTPTVDQTLLPIGPLRPDRLPPAAPSTVGRGRPGLGRCVAARAGPRWCVPPWIICRAKRAQTYRIQFSRAIVQPPVLPCPREN